MTASGSCGCKYLRPHAAESCAVTGPAALPLCASRAAPACSCPQFTVQMPHTSAANAQLCSSIRQEDSAPLSAAPARSASAVCSASAAIMQSGMPGGGGPAAAAGGCWRRGWGRIRHRRAGQAARSGRGGHAISGGQPLCGVSLSRRDAVIIKTRCCHGMCQWCKTICTQQRLTW